MFGHSKDPAAEAEQLALKLEALELDTTPKSKERRAAVLNTSAATHGGVKLGPSGVPLTKAQLRRWIIDLLHVDMNEGKLTWKWAAMRLLPRAVRVDVEAWLRECGLWLDLRTKEEGRQTQDKFWDDCDWQQLCEGGGKSPGGAVVFAKIVFMIAKHYDHLAAVAAAKPAPSAKPTAASRGGSFTLAGAQAAAASSKAPPVKSTPAAIPSPDHPWEAAWQAAKSAARTEAELLAHQPSLAAIRKKYGRRAERLIAMALTFDSHLNFRRVMRRRFTFGERHQCALVFARSHRVWFEQFERVSCGMHRSGYPHGVQFKAVLQMLEVGDLWPFSLGPLESLHAEMGRIGDRTGCKRVTADVGDEVTLSARMPNNRTPAPTKLVETKAIATQASSMATRFIGASALLEDVEMCIPARSQNRMILAPEEGGGRVSKRRLAPKLGMSEIDPENTVVREFAKLLSL